MKDFTELRLSGEQMYLGGFLTLHRDRVSLPDGQESVREYIEHPDGVVVVPFLDDETLVMVRQYRYGLQRHTLEFPAGKIEPAESIQCSARRELLEETGYTCDFLENSLQLPLPVAYVRASFSLTIARGLSYLGHPGEPGEFIEVLRVPVVEAMSRIMSGDICDMKDIIAVLLLTQQCKKT